MSSGAPHRLIEKKGKQLSKFLGIDSVPSTQLIATMQSRINNPIFTLSMTDYEAMCGNKIMVRMMSKVIGCEEKQLKKFCKYINVFTENIKSSPKSIKNKMKVTNSINASKRKGSLSVLPDDILEKIVNKYKTIFKIKYKLKDWIPPEKLDWKKLSLNPNAIELLKANLTKIDWESLSSNPNSEAIELLKANPSKISWGILSANPAAIDLLKANNNEINWEMLSANPSDGAIELLKNKINEENEMSEDDYNDLGCYNRINWANLSSNTNPEAIELLKANRDYIYWANLSSNTNSEAIELLKNKINEENEMSEDDYNDLGYYNRINWANLSSNTNPEAIELLKKKRRKISWGKLSANSSAIKLLKETPTKIKWNWLSENPNPEAIELLKANPKKIDWKELSGNPAIFDEILE
jgi:hypothetical protein